MVIEFVIDKTLLEGDPETRIAEFLSKVDMDISQRMSDDRIEAGVKYFDDLCQRNLRADVASDDKGNPETIDDVTIELKGIESSAMLEVNNSTGQEVNTELAQSGIAGKIDDVTMDLDNLESAVMLEAYNTTGSYSNTELAQSVDESRLGDKESTPALKECDGTAATVVESLDLSTNEGFSILSQCGHNQVSIVLNGTRYVGNICSEVSSLQEDVEDSDDEPIASTVAGNTSRGETVKEQSRRLLIQYRNSQAFTSKAKRSKRLMMRPRTIKEEPCIDDRSLTVRVDTVEPLSVVPLDDPTDDDRRRVIQIILHRKFKPSCRKRSDASRKHKKSEAVSKVVSSGSFIGLEWWNYVVRIFAYTVRLYSCSTVRYAMFRSNRSFKPGD